MHRLSRPCTVLLVDDTRSNIDILVEALKDDYRLAVALDGRTALAAASACRPDLILLDIMMPDMNGFEVCRTLRDAETGAPVPVIFLTALGDLQSKSAAFEAGGVDYVTKPFEIAEVKARVNTHLAFKLAREDLADRNQALDRRVRERTREVEEAQREILFRLGLASDFRDNDTGAHIRRIRGYVEILARRLGMPEEEAAALGLAGAMHDVGKIGIPDAILLKPGRLSPAEWEIMKTHAAIGARILDGSRSPLLEAARVVALTHHERWDGAGYPAGLRGEEIPRPGRVVGVADVFDALLSRRPYKAPWPAEEAARWILSASGGRFDPVVVEAFRDCVDDLLRVAREFPDQEPDQAAPWSDRQNGEPALDAGGRPASDQRGALDATERA